MVYRNLSGNGENAVSNYVYNAEGKVIYQVDFGRHGKLTSGHGHLGSSPGNIDSGHLPENHVPFNLVPKPYLTIPANAKYSVPLGQ